MLKTPLAEEIIRSNVHEGDVINLDIGKGDSKLEIKITSANKQEKS